MERLPENTGNFYCAAHSLCIIVAKIPLLGAHQA